MKVAYQNGSRLQGLMQSTAMWDIKIVLTFSRHRDVLGFPPTYRGPED